MAGKGSKPGEHRGGRKKGTPNKATAKRQEIIAASGKTPLDVMLESMRFADEQAAELLGKLIDGGTEAPDAGRCLRNCCAFAP